jgi:hypothetical protein
LAKDLKKEIEEAETMDQIDDIKKKLKEIKESGEMSKTWEVEVKSLLVFKVQKLTKAKEETGNVVE